MGALKNSIFRGGGVPKKPIYRKELPKKGAWTVCRFFWGGRGGAWQKRGGGAFERWVMPQYTLWFQSACVIEPSLCRVTPGLLPQQFKISNIVHKKISAP